MLFCWLIVCVILVGLFLIFCGFVDLICGVIVGLVTLCMVFASWFGFVDWFALLPRCFWVVCCCLLCV